MKQIFNQEIQEINLGGSTYRCIFEKSLGSTNNKKRTIEEIVEKIKLYDTNKEIIISGNEPFLNPNIKLILETLRKKGFKNIAMRSNGLILENKEILEKIKGLFDKIIIPIFSLKNEENEQVTKIFNSFKQIQKGLKIVKELKISVRIEYIISIYNSSFSNLISFIKAFSIKEVKIIFPISAKDEEFYFPKITPNLVQEIAKIQYKIKQEKIVLIEGEPVYLPLKPIDLDVDGNDVIITKNQVYNKQKIKASIIIPTYNREKALSLTLESLRNQNYAKENYEIIIVDDGSTDNTKAMLKTFKSTLNYTYIYWPREKTYTFGELRNRAGPARNVGIKNATGEIIIFVDSDIVASPKFVTNHMKHHETNDNLVVLGYRKWFIENLMNFEKSDIKNFTKILKSPNLPDLREPYFSLFADEIIKMPSGWDHLHTNNISVSKKNLIKVGNFDKNFVAWSTEDNELGYRFYKAGLEFILDRKLIGYHIYHKPEFVDFSGFQRMAYLSKEIFYKKFLDRNLYKHYLNIFENNVADTIVLGNSCSHKCSCCWGLDIKGTTISIENIKQKIKQNYNSKTIILTGGNLNFKKRFMEILPELIPFKGIVVLKANIEIFSDKHFVSLIMKVLPNTHFLPYIFSNKKEIYENITKKQIDFEKVLQGFKNLARYPYSTDILIPIVKQNYKYLKQMISVFSKHFSKFMLYHPHQPENPTYFHVAETQILKFKDSVIDLKFAKPYINECLEFAKHKGINVEVDLRFFKLRSVKNGTF